MLAKFIAEDGPFKGLELPLSDGDRDTWVIGRDPEFCQLLIEDPSVSRQHVLCKKNENGGFLVENLSETNKTFVNDEEITSPHLLKHSDFLKIGSGSYRFYEETPEIEFNPETPENETADSQLENEMKKGFENEEIDQLMSDIAPLPDELEVLPENKMEHDEEDEEEDSIFGEEEYKDTGDLAQINFDIAEQGRYLLKVISGVNNGAEFPMQIDHTYLIGTDSSFCDIIFNDNSVSRQHAKLSIDNENSIYIEDLKSRNGTLVDGEPIKEKIKFDQNALITIGTTSFVIYDRESAMQTVISPLMPSIVKILQLKEETQRRESEQREKDKALELEKREALNLQNEPKAKEKSQGHVGAFILTAAVTGLFVLGGIATTTLFKSEPVVTEQNINIDEILAKTLEPFPSIKYNFNKSTGMLLLAGHVLTTTDKAKLVNNLQGLPFMIRNTDDNGVVIDELALREINPTLSRNQAWRSVSIQSTAPGKFILSGYLQTRKEADQLWDYVSNNFSYINSLERKIVVEEDVISQVSSLLMQDGFKDVTVQMSEGELTLTGFIPTGKETILETIVTDMKAIPGIRGVKNYVAALAADQSMINLTDRYDVTGSSLQGKGNLSVVINGKILIRGDTLDGMLITSIKPNAIFLEKDSIKYRIDYNK